MPKHHVERNNWVKASNGHAPPGTLVGGHDVNGEPIYVARALHNGDLIPGKLVASQRCTYVSYDGLEYKKEEYEVLVGSSNIWIPTKNSIVPTGAFLGGQTYRGDLFYVARVRYQGTITTGKMLQGVCSIPFGGKEVTFDEYEVLLS